MIGTAKVKDDSKYRYKGLTLNIVGVYIHHMDELCHDIYTLGTVTYRLSLEGTEWGDKQRTTVLHDSELEDIKTDGSVEANVWYDRLKSNGQKVINNLFNPTGLKSLDDVYDAYLNQSNLKRTGGVKSSNDLKIGDDAFFRTTIMIRNEEDIEFVPIVIEQSHIDQILKYKGGEFEDYWYIAKQ